MARVGGFDAVVARRSYHRWWHQNPGSWGRWPELILIPPVVAASPPSKKSGTEELKQYVPVEPSGGGDIPLAVQVSFFGCGGTAIGVCLSHRVADAMSLVTFINAWAAACRGDAKTIAVTRPTFGSASRFPPADFSKYFPSRAPPPRPPQKIVTKRYVFNEQKLAALRKAASGPMMDNPTRVEAVSAFIWRHFIKAARLKHQINGEERVFAATHAVDIRPRASPPLPHQFFGNACARAMAMATAAEKEPDYYELAIKLRDGIRKADADYVTRLENGDTFLKYYAAMRRMIHTF
ncbi:Stemmadenine O-acetyltransferase [Sesamum alatum]|uniref:Stemmadenine O-acetyltransferase n=1 Tax=Sesamum alatum TaxID=300844 RepID=A0AAE1XZT9_9LAMI|nr:Stemmadenine O-acetyltransferase [Sesamum alatum]